jgi:hypothetical protein
MAHSVASCHVNQGFAIKTLLLLLRSCKNLAKPRISKQSFKIQTEFMEAQMNSFNEQAKVLSEIYTKAAKDAMKTPFGV